MGIVNFHKFLKEKYNDAFKKTWLETYDHIYIDLNYALHYSSYGAHTEKEIYTRLYKFIENTLLELVPTKTVVLATDGSAPLAKLLLQRRRRMNISKNSSNNFGLLFTVGTKFMESLNEKMMDFMKYIEIVFCIKVEFIGGVDESELKLKRKISECKNSKDSHIFVSNDADTIVMLCTLNNFKNVFVHNKSETLSICKLLDLHTDSVGCSKNFGLDFAFISILFGNDYLPKLKYINYENVWKAYKSNIINKDLSINKNILSLFLSSLKKLLKECYNNKFEIDELYHPMYDNYLDGLTWCLNMYYNGKCYRYNYMYKYDISPHPIGLLFHIYKYPDSLKLNTETYEHINQQLYPILVLPKSSIHLIDKQYHEFANKSKILYQEEECEECKYSKNIIKHKKTHKDITFEDIEILIENFKNIS